MARKLNSQYNFSYDNLKVLLGGWNTWKENNAKDANAYPIETTATVAPGAGDNSAPVITGPSVVIITPGSSPSGGTPAPNLVTQPTAKP